MSRKPLRSPWESSGSTAQHLAEAMRLAPRWVGRLDFHVLCLLGQARVTAPQGDPTGALQLVPEAKQRVRTPQAAWELDILEACEVQLWVTQGNLPPALNWLQRQAPETPMPRLRPSTPFYVLAHEHIAIAPIQVLLAQGRASGDPAPLHRVLTLLARQREETERQGLIWCDIKALALQALAYHALGDETRALSTLGEALVLAQPAGYIRIFADEGEPMAELLQQIDASGIALEYLRYVTFWASPSSIIAPPEPPPCILRA